MEAFGKIIAILPVQSGVSQRTGNPWCIQSFVLETFDQYPKKIPFEVFGDEKLKQFNIQMGETLTIHFDVDGREWNGKWFPRISCYNISRQEAQQQVAQPVAPQTQPQPQPQSPVYYPNAPQPQQSVAQPTQQTQGQGNDPLPF